jgi:hypothetical protein
MVPDGHKQPETQCGYKAQKRASQKMECDEGMIKSKKEKGVDEITRLFVFFVT